MQNNDVRLFFTKTGMAKYISHLDLMRCMTRAVKRAQLPLWFTQGYNPHLFMTFARPLSLGQESLCEVVDVRLDGEMTFREMQKRLNETLPQGITIVSVAKPVHDPVDIAFADYSICLHTQEAHALLACIETAFAAPEILVMKKAKKGKRKIEKEMDIKPSVFAFSAVCEKDSVLLSVRLAAESQNNINPSLLLQALTKDMTEQIEAIDILKQKILCADMTTFA